MQKTPNSPIARLAAIVLLLVMITVAQANEKVKLAGYQQIITDINQQNRHALKKLDGKIYHLRVTGQEAASYELSLFPEALFEIKKLGRNLFEVTLVDPLSLWKKHKKEPFQIKWVLDEIVL